MINIAEFREAILKKRYEWRKHILERLMERGLLQDDIIQVIMDGEMIEIYSKDTPYPSGLFFLMVKEKPLHVVASFDEPNQWAYIITAYQADLDHFEPDFKTRKKQ